MGICKCKKKTDLFCFVHKKSVCENCIVTSEHSTCVVKKYVDWLTDSDFDPASCGICKGELMEGKTLRLMCLDMFHPECIDIHSSSLPPHTAKAGYLCPLCSKPIFPMEMQSNELEEKLKIYLSQSEWSKSLLNGQEQEPESNVIPEKVSREQEGIIDSEAILPSPSEPILTDKITFNRPTLSSPQKPMEQAPATTTPNTDFGIASRKPQPKDFTITLNDEEDEDKYRKRSILQLFTALGFVQQISKPTKGSKRIRIDTGRVITVVAIIFCMIIVIILGASITRSLPEEPT